MLAGATVNAMELELLPDENWSRVLCIVAHPDDMEYGASAAVSAWTSRGVDVNYLLLTAGEAGMQRPPGEVGPLRAKEQEAACEVVGVSDLQILDHPDGMLEYSLDLRRDIARAVRRLRPDAVVTANFDVEAYGSVNQADHRVTGLAVIDGVSDANNPWVFRDLVEEGLEPWRTQWLLIAGHPEPTHGVKVSTADVDNSVESLRCHRQYLADLPDHPEPGDFIPPILSDGGALMGSDYAVVFRAFHLGGNLAE